MESKRFIKICSLSFFCLHRSITEYLKPNANDNNLGESTKPRKKKKNILDMILMKNETLEEIVQDREIDKSTKIICQAQ